MSKKINTNVKSVSINLEDSARAVVKLESRGKKIIYSRYIADHGVTLETVSEHVQSLAALAIELDEIDPNDKAALKAFKTRVRNGLNTNLGKTVPSKTPSGKYITAEGLKAESWEAFVEKAKAEWEAANNK